MSLAKCFSSMNSGKPVFTEAEMSEIRKLALNSMKGTTQAEAEKIAVQKLLDEAIAEQKTISDLIAEEMGIEVPQEVEAMAGEAAAVDEVLRTSPAANLEKAENLKQESEGDAAQSKPVEKPAENVQNEIDQTGGVRFSKGKKDSAPTLIIQHNLSEQNLLHADRMGGIPIPSLAITKAEHPLEGFGEITLVGGIDMADPKGYAATKVFGADIYSPRYPQLSYKLDNSALKKLNEVLSPYREGRQIYGGEIQRIDDVTQIDAFREYAKAQGVDQNKYYEQRALAEQLMLDVGAEEKIFQGFTNSGNRKYIPHTLDNVIKLLKKELRGGEGFNYGVGSIRSKYTPQFKSIEQIRKAKDRLMTSDTFKNVKEEIDTDFTNLADEFRSYHPIGSEFGFLDTMSSTLYDAATMGLPRAFRENGFESVPQEKLQAAAEFLDKLRTLPTEYFEAKIMRAVDLSEFKGAVVPDDIDQKALDVLKKRGITNVLTYNKNDVKDRAAKIKQLATEAELLFSQSQSKARNPYTITTLRSAINEAMGKGFAELLETTDKFKIISSERVAEYLGGAAKFSKASQTDTPAFKAWFGDSKVVDADGKPLVVYHGTAFDVEAFQKSFDSDAIYFSPAPEFAGEFAEGKVVPEGVLDDEEQNAANVVPVYLSLRNPFDYKNGGHVEAVARLLHEKYPKVSAKVFAKGLATGHYEKVEDADAIAAMKELGHDGFYVNEQGDTAFDNIAVFSPTQIKSATGNIGTFDPKNPDIRYSKDGRILAFVTGGKAYFVADNIGSDDSVKGLLHHELGVHALQLGRTDEEFQGILKRIESMRKMGDKRVKAAFARVPNDTPAHLVTEEATGYLSEAHPDMPIIQKLIARFRALLRSIGKSLPVLQRAKWFQWAADLSVDDILLMAQQATNRAPQDLAGATGRETYKSGGQRAESFARLALEELAAENDALFAHKKSVSKTLTGVISDVVSGSEYLGDLTREDERAESDADHRYAFKTANDKLFYVYEKDNGEVWIDVSRLDQGSGGAAIYAAMGNYAYNTGKRFIGDPNGLSPEAVVRRTHHMLSSALRFGTTRHLDAAKQQVWGAPEDGVTPLVWRGSDIDKVEAMIHTIVETSEAMAPSLKEYHYDFQKSQFSDAQGRPVTGAAMAANTPRDAGIGEKTARRVVLLRSLLDADRAGGSGGRSGILEKLLSYDNSSLPENMRRLFSRRADGDVDSGNRGGGTGQKPLDLQGGESGSSASWDAPEPSKLDDIIYTLQDKHIDMKRVVAAIKDAGGKLIEKFNPYLAEELFHGRAAKRTHDFVNTELKPLLTDMQMRGLTVEELDQYLHARHAKEANALIAERDPNMPDGGSGMTNAEADEYMEGLDEAKRKRLEAAAAKVDSIITKTRDLYVSYGLISQDQADSWASMFKHYVPLMREDHDGGMGVGQGFSIKGKEVKHRTGSTAKVVDILANIALQREKAITRGEKNRVAVALAGLVKLNPNPDFWTFGKPPVERVLNEKTGLVEDRIDPMFKSRENVVVAKIKDSSGEVHERAIIFNEDNERAMRMAESFKNLDHIQLGGVMGVSAMITRYFASVNTQYNPVFGIVNIARDVQGMALNLSSTPLAKHRSDVLKLIPSAVKGIYLDSRSERKGRAANSKWAQLWEELQDEGGMTGYRDLYRNSSERANEIKRELDPTKWHNSKLGKIFTANGALKVPLTIAQERAGWLFDWLSDYNQTLEGATRLAAYKVAIDNGMTKQQAASLAKNITVNFNRKGHIGQQAGAMYAFFNAAMQGSARIVQTMLTYENGKVGLTKAGKAIVYGGMTLGAIQAVMLAAAGFDDDEPPEFVRERAMIIPIGGKKYITIPMPLGFHVFPNLGRIPTEWALGGFKDTGKRVADMVGIFIEAFNPMGSAGMSLQTLMPTAIDPLVALAENKDWTGKPIYKEDFNSMKPTPGFERNKDTATAWAKGIAEGLNYLSGGTDYTPGAISPTADQIDYLIGQVTGGVGRELGKIAQTGESAVTGEALPPHKVPLLGRFYGNAENQSSQGNAYYSNLKRIFQVEAEIKGRREDKLPIDEYKADNPEWKLITRAKYADNIIGKLKKQKRELIERGAEREKIRAIEDRITSEMRRLNEAVRMLEEKEAA